MLCYSSRHGLTLFCQSLQSLSTPRSTLPDESSRINEMPLKIQAEVANQEIEEGKNQINPPSTRGRTRTKGALFSLDPVRPRRTEIERRGGERNGHDL
ncbi:hypothetical protein HU200_040409 [Digitaria exilis]|uniref:Uncharacterized protein n=1 Tax=Digitaria exilis TaxID=1010633 RepID=A0A835EJZ4_9POAL|nr:hypothetical protein HU200_040409 [Digitaria exilis]